MGGVNFGGRVTAPGALRDHMGEDDQDQRCDLELLEAHLAGDARAFGMLVARHEHRLWWAALRNSRGEADAADALQEALVKAMRSAHTFRTDSSVVTWLHRILVNSCHDRMRGRHGPADGVIDERAIGGRHDEHAMDPAVSMVMRQAMERLPEEQRTVVVEVDLMGWPIADVARRLGIPEGTVKSRRARARATLRRQLHLLESEVCR